MIENTYPQHNTTNPHTITQKSKMTTMIDNNVVEVQNKVHYNDILLMQEFILEAEYYGDYYISDVEQEKMEEMERKDEEELLKNVQTHGFVEFSNNCDVFDVCPGSGYCDF